MINGVNWNADEKTAGRVGLFDMCGNKNNVYSFV
jgi:hypothetical protein